MRIPQLLRTLSAVLFALVVLPWTSVVPSAAQSTGLISDAEYESPQFGYTITWGGDWIVRQRDVISNRGGFDTLVLRNGTSSLTIQGQGGVTATDAAQARVNLVGGDITEQDLTSTAPTATMTTGRDTVRVQAVDMPSGEGAIVIMLSARTTQYPDSFASAQSDVLFNGVAIFSSEMAQSQPSELTGTETPASSESDGTTRRTNTATSDSTAPTEAVQSEATAPTAGVTSSRDNSATEAAAQSASDTGTYEGTVYDYTVTYDAAIWSELSTIDEATSDGVQLEAEDGLLTIWTYDVYGSDSVACLDGESAYYANEAEGIANWEPATDANGDPIREEGGDYSYAVFTLDYTNSSGETYPLVDYIECRPIPNEEAMMIIVASSPRETYNDFLDKAITVADGITWGSGTTRTTTATAEATEVVTNGESGFDGSLFTSPSFGYTFEVPYTWDVVSESLQPNDERVELTNGVSTITLWGTDGYTGADLAGCVDFAVDESGLTLQLESDSSGNELRGATRSEAYGTFSYTNGAGDEQMYSFSCRPINAEGAVLILMQDVPFDQYGNQRRFRTEIESSIQMP